MCESNNILNTTRLRFRFFNEMGGFSILNRYSEILESCKTEVRKEINTCKNEKKMVGAIPGETRTAKGGASKPVQSPGATQTVGLEEPKTQAEYDALAPGTKYVHPNGGVRTKQ